MSTTDPFQEQSVEGRQGAVKADLLNRIIAKTIDFIIVVALYEIIPKAGYVAGIAYLLIADALFEGRSAGKRLMGLKVIVRYSAGRTEVCGFKDSVIRNFPFAAAYILFGILKAIPLVGWILSFAVVVAVLLFESLIMLGSEEGIRLGDDLAKTHVVEDRQGG
jgi:hypothetical protein